MEVWQKAYITNNLTSLISNIKCNVFLLSYLSQVGILAKSDEELLNAKGSHAGDQEKSRYLLEVIATRTGGYFQLAKALQSCNQTGALNTLIKGIHSNVISRNVIFQGKLLSLEELCHPIGREYLQKIITDNLDASNYEQFLSNEILTIAISTIPDQLKYYIPRTLSYNSQLDPEVFEKLQSDIFCIEGIELYQMSGLSNRKAHDTTDMSRNQIHEVTARFILLEHQAHFQEIATATKRTVHWIKHNNNDFFYVKSSTGSGIQAIQKFLISNNSQQLSEEEFLLRCRKSPQNAPILLYDSPGMGKSILLANLARQNKSNQPSCSVVYLEISEFISKVRQIGQGYSSTAIKQAMVESITENSFGRAVMNMLFDKTNHQIELFLDAFDEVSASELDAAHKILDCIAKECKNIRMYITTRPHRRNELESKFGVLGYNIMPFDDSNKLLFFLKFWETEHGVEITDGIGQFAQHCIKTVTSEMTSDEVDIAGIPLQCRMLAEIWAKDAKTGGLIPTELQFQLNSIFKLYRHYIDTKFSTFCTDESKQICYDFHVSESFRTLFPEKCQHFHKEAHVPDYELIYRIGILEPLKSDSTTPTFQHRTLAEFFAAEYFAISAVSRYQNKPNNDKEFIHVFFHQVLMWSSSTSNDYYSNIHDLRESGTGSYEHERIEAKFQNAVVCRFLNFFLSTMHSPGHDFGTLKDALRESKYYNSETLVKLLESCLNLNAVHLYCYLLDIFLDLDNSSDKAFSILTFKQNLLLDNENYEMTVQNRRLIINLRINPNLPNIVATAVKYSSLNLVKLSCKFLESVTGKMFHEFSCNMFQSPMYFALRRGHYQIFEYLLSFDREEFYKQPLLHWCLEESASAKNVTAKLQILKIILHERADLLNKPHPDYHNWSPLLAWRAHFSLIKFLIEAGANPSQTNDEKENIAHYTAFYFSADEYHELVKLIVSHSAQIIFNEPSKSGFTPVHRALLRIDLKSETLELLAKKCNIDFNAVSKWSGSQLAVAIEKRSERVIKDIIRLGGSKEKLDSKSREKLSVKYNM